LEPPYEYFDPVSALFFKQFLKYPFQIASIVPSSKTLVERVGSKMDFSRLRVIAGYGPVEGEHSRGIVRRVVLDSHLLLFALDAAFAQYVEWRFVRNRC
jgi:phospholipid N-methyltransferase